MTRANVELIPHPKTTRLVEERDITAWHNDPNLLVGKGFISGEVVSRVFVVMDYAVKRVKGAQYDVVYEDSGTDEVHVIDPDTLIEMVTASGAELIDVAQHFEQYSTQLLHLFFQRSMPPAEEAEAEAAVTAAMCRVIITLITTTTINTPSLPLPPPPPPLGRPMTTTGPNDPKRVELTRLGPKCKFLFFTFQLSAKRWTTSRNSLQVIRPCS
jgi:hypothetical protein